MGTKYLTPRPPISLVRPSLVVADWTAVQATGWTLSNTATGALRAAWVGGSTVDWTTTLETGLALVWPKLGTLSGAERLARIQIAYSEATANGIGVGVGFASAASPVGATWFARTSTRDGSGTVNVRDEADSAGAPYSLATQTRRGVINAEIASLTTVVTWGKVAGAAASYNERRYAGTHVTFSEGADVYPVLYFVGGSNAGSVDITDAAVLFRTKASL